MIIGLYILCKGFAKKGGDWMEHRYGGKQLTKCDYVADELKKQIASGEYKEGDQLPPEPELCQMFGVSRITVREALKKLNMMGLVDIRQGKGTFVRPIDLSLFMRPLFQRTRFEETDVEAVYFARECIEGGAAYLAAQQATPEEIEKLGVIIETLRRSVIEDDFVQRGKCDRQFHLELARASHNPILFACVQTLDEIDQACVKRKSKHARAMDNCYEEHYNIFDAVRRRDPAGARAAMESHARNAKLFLQSNTEKSPKMNK